jgi:iron complex transport system substrate-binding protein
MPDSRFKPARYLPVMLLFLTSLALAVDYPVTVIDYLGREVTLERPPQRVVALMASHAEAVAALDALDLLVGVDDYSDWPAAVTSLPQVGNGFQPNVEAIVLLQPDLVLTDQFSGSEQLLDGLGLTVFAGTPQDYGDIFAFHSQLGTLLDREGQAEALNSRLQEQLAELELLTADLPAPEVFVELDPTPFSAGPGSYIGTLLELVGGRNVIPAELGDWPQVEPEFVISSDPQVILLLDAPFGETAASVAARPGWGDLRAVADGRVEALTENEVNALSRPGPRVAYAAAVLAQRLHPAVSGSTGFDPLAFESDVSAPAAAE